MASREEIEERRSKVKQLVIEGFSTKEIVRLLKVSLRTIQHDRKTINHDFFDDLKEDSVERIMAEFLLRYNGIYREARKTYRETTNDNAKIGALRIMAQQEKDKIEILQSLGFLNNAANNLGFNGENNLDVARMVDIIKETREEMRKEMEIEIRKKIEAEKQP